MLQCCCEHLSSYQVINNELIPDTENVLDDEKLRELAIRPIYRFLHEVDETINTLTRLKIKGSSPCLSNARL